MIRILNKTHCQVLHRKTPHEIMIEAIEDVSKVKPSEVLYVLIKYEEWLLADMEHVLPAGVKHPKLTILILIAAEFSYFDGFYRRRKYHSENGIEAYARVKAFISDYLIKL